MSGPNIVASSPDGFFSQDDNGEFYLSPKALALIFGVSEDQVREVGNRYKPQGLSDGEIYTAHMPHLWMQNGRRRIREAFAAIGDDDFSEAVAYLARLEGRS
ncbi:hypothetical protein [Nocardia sp. NPDC059239]|uniref:hypothetical protein n=1 Tax=unclassified Nocardia TaxID=2637762 RepID=UPI003686AF04